MSIDLTGWSEEETVGTTAWEWKPDGFSFMVGPNNDIEALRIDPDGSFYVHGNKVTDDVEIYRAFVRFLKETGTYNK